MVSTSFATGFTSAPGCLTPTDLQEVTPEVEVGLGWVVLVSFQHLGVTFLVFAVQVWGLPSLTRVLDSFLVLSLVFRNDKQRAGIPLNGQSMWLSIPRHLTLEPWGCSASGHVSLSRPTPAQRKSATRDEGPVRLGSPGGEVPVGRLHAKTGRFHHPSGNTTSWSY